MADRFTIPIAEPRVSVEPLPGVRQDIRATRGTFGGQEARAISQLGEVVEGIGRQLGAKEEREARRSLEIKKEADALQERKDKMYSNATILEYQEKYADEKPAFSRTRLDADGVSNEFRTWHAKTESDLLVKAGNERQREMIKAGLSSQETKNYVNIRDYENSQLQLADTELNDSLLTNAMTEAGRPESSEITILDADLTVRDALDTKVKGMDAETAKRVKKEGISTFHGSVIEGKLVSNLEFAKSYFKEVKDELLPKDREKFRQAIQKENISQTAQRIAEKITIAQDDRVKWDAHVDILTKDEEIREETRKILDRKKKKLDSQDAALVTREKVDIFTNVWNSIDIDDGGTKADMAENIFTKIAANNLNNSLHGRDQKDVETDRATLGKVLDRIYNGEFKSETELLEFFPSFSKPDYKWITSEFRKYQQELKTGKKADDSVIKYANAKAAFQNVFQIKTYSAEEHGSSFSAMLKLLESQGKDLSVGEAESVMRQHMVDNKGGVGDIQDRSFFGVPIWDEEISYEEALKTNRMGEYLPKITEDDNDTERVLIRSAFIDEGYRDEIPEQLLRLYKKKYIDNLPMSLDEETAFDNGLLTLKRRKK